MLVGASRPSLKGIVVPKRQRPCLDEIRESQLAKLGALGCLHNANDKHARLQT